MHTEVGTSLGLSIVRGILEKHGCTVHMVSKPGVGTTFWFDLPLEEADSDEMQVHAERRRYAGERVLVGGEGRGLTSAASATGMNGMKTARAGHTRRRVAHGLQR